MPDHFLGVHAHCGWLWYVALPGLNSAGDIHSPRIAVTEALQLEMRHFIDCVAKGKRPRSDGEAGLRVVRVLEAGMRSLRSGGARVAYHPEGVRA